MSRKTLLFYAIASSLLGFAARSQNVTSNKTSLLLKSDNGITSGRIDKIEFINNPSAKYDAFGASTINIKMNKDVQSA